MKILSTIIKDLGLELTENLTLISHNLGLLNSEKESMYIELLDSYSEDVSEQIFETKTDPGLLAETLRLLSDVLSRNMREDKEVSQMVTVAVVNKIAKDSIFVANKIMVALEHLESEDLAISMVVNSWEFNSPLETITDSVKFNSLLGSFSGQELDDNISRAVAHLENEELTDLAKRLDVYSVRCDFGESFDTAYESYRDIYAKISRLNDSVLEEMILTIENPSEGPSSHHILNRIVGKVNLAHFADIKSNANGISTELRKAILKYLAFNDDIRSSLMESGDFSGLSKIDGILKERANYAQHGIQCLDRLDIAIQRCLRAVDANVEKLLKIKSSSKDLFNEMYPVLSHEDMKRAS